MVSPLDTFLARVTSSLETDTFVKIVTSEKRDAKNELKSISIKRIRIKDGERLSFTYRYKTRDEVKNYPYDEALGQLRDILARSFASLELFTTEENTKIVRDAQGRDRIKTRAPEITSAPSLSHDKQKYRHVRTEGNLALRELGVLGASFEVLPSMQDKYKQIDKFVEIIESLLAQTKLPNHLRVIDMGSGKGYLTFALYDYLTNTRHIEAEVSGVELRPNLVNLCNNIAERVGFSGLHFHTGSIADINNKNTNEQSVSAPLTRGVSVGRGVKILPPNVLVALHACDTATDDAIYQGIIPGSEIIVCSPCCHKQIRKELSVAHSLASILDNGILEERQAEIVTDGIRALLMEAYGYDTKVFEYISSEHTGKNCMITGVKTNKPKDTAKILQKVAEIKEFFGIKHHHLEDLLSIKTKRQEHNLLHPNVDGDLRKKLAHS